jgi:hypothetical protein
VPRRQRTLVKTAAGLALAGVAVWAVLRFDAELAPVVDRIERANPWLLIPALALEALSFGGYVGLFRATLEGRAPSLDWRAITQITFASVVATRLFAAGGAGGIALTAWALDAAGLEPGSRHAGSSPSSSSCIRSSSPCSRCRQSRCSPDCSVLGRRRPWRSSGSGRRSPSPAWHSPRCSRPATLSAASAASPPARVRSERSAGAS